MSNLAHNFENGGGAYGDVKLTPKIHDHQFLQLVATTTEREWIRLKEVMRLTGWNRRYVSKSQQNGVLDTRQDYPKAKHWYRRSQIVQLMS